MRAFQTRSLCALTVFLSAALPVFSPAGHAAPTDNVGALLAQAKAASGGDAWNSVRSLDTKSKLVQGGLSGVQEEWDDVRTGAYAVQYQLGPVSGRQGYDGQTVWEQDQSGQSRPIGDADSRQAAVSSAYRNCLAYWFPDRSPAVITPRPPQTAAGNTFDVVHVVPDGGRPFDLWLDRATHRIDRTVESGASETTTTLFSDYRAVAGLTLPFLIRQTNGKAQYDQAVVVQSVSVDAPITHSLFQIPPPPAPDFAIAGGRTSSTVPFQFLDKHIYLEARINGQGPFLTVLDTGGANVVDPAFAARLHLKTQGALEGGGFGDKSVNVGLAPVQSLQIGDVTLNRQLFYVIPLPAVGGPPLHTIVGYELFKRFVIGIDYDRRLLTLTLPDHFRAPAGATAVPFRFNQRLPEVDGAIDGYPGAFTIDTGSGGSVDLTRPFVVRNQLSRRYPHQVKALSGYGVGGPEYAQVTRADTLTLGGVTVHGPVTDLSLAKAGAAANQSVAGNIGEGVLRQFNVIFDYAHQSLYFTPNADHGKRDVFNRSGLSLRPQGAAWRVADVILGSPATVAGLKIGDRILTVNGRTATQQPDLSPLWHSPPGTRVPLVVQSGAGRRVVTLTLRDII